MSESNGHIPAPKIPPIAFELRRPGFPLEVVTMTPVDKGLGLYGGQWYINGILQDGSFKSVRLLHIATFYRTPEPREIKPRCLCGAIIGESECGCPAPAGVDGGHRP